MFVKAFLKSFSMIFADLVAGCLTLKTHKQPPYIHARKKKKQAVEKKKAMRLKKLPTMSEAITGKNRFKKIAT